MFEDHWLSCTLHSGPARWPRPCDCGGITNDKLYVQASGRLGYTPAGHLRSFVQLWKARTVYLYESHASPLRFLRRVAMRLASYLRRYPPRADVAQQFAVARRTRTK